VPYHLVKEEIIARSGWTVEIVRRYEIVHCNGWPKTYEGARISGYPQAER
jgi:hypothetical protein